MHGTLCHCKKEVKETWTVVGLNCWRRLPLELKSRVRAFAKKTPASERTAAIKACFKWLDENPEKGSGGTP